MIKIIIRFLVFNLFFINISFAQNKAQLLKVRDFKRVNLDLDGHRHAIKAVNSNLNCILCKVKTNINAKDLNVTLSNGKVVKKIQSPKIKDEVWVYVPHNTGSITFSYDSNRASPTTVLLPKEIKPATVFNFKLSIEKNTNYREQDTLKFFSDPEEAELYIFDVFTGKTTPVLDEIRYPGSYNIKLTKPYYYVIDTTIKVIKGGKNSWHFKLKSKLSQIQFIPNSESKDAMVKLDGMVVDNSKLPFILENIFPGEHQIEVFKDLYKPLQFKFTPTNKDSVINVRLTPNYGILDLNYYPDDALVTLDDTMFLEQTQKGSGFIHKKINQGKHRLSIKRIGYDDYHEDIKIPLLNDLTKVVSLKPNYSSLQIITNPPEAKIYIDDFLMLKLSNAKFNNFLKGKHKISLYKEGYRVYQDSFTIKDEKNFVINKNLTPILSDSIRRNNPLLFDSNLFKARFPRLSFTDSVYHTFSNWHLAEKAKVKELGFGSPFLPYGFFSLQTLPTQANVFINDINLTQKSNIFIKIPVGKYNLKLLNDGYPSFSTKIKIVNKEVTNLSWFFGSLSQKTTFKTKLPKTNFDSFKNQDDYQYKTSSQFGWGISEIFIPGLGQYKTNDDNSKWWILKASLVWIGAISSIILEQMAQSQYQEYQNAPEYINRAPLLKSANLNHQLSLFTATATLGLHLYDVIHIFKKISNKNTMRRNKLNGFDNFDNLNNVK